jgi:hypothetical protein
VRRRKRRDYHLRTYKYWARPVAGIPEAFWQLADKMRETWNALVETLQNTSHLEKTRAKDEQKKVWAAQRETCGRIVAESGLNWECGPAILARFETACRMAIRGERGWPKQQPVTRSVMIPHCYTSGGIARAGLFRTSRRLSMRPVPTEAFADSRRATVRQRLTRGVFGFDGGVIEFETILHRPIPETAIIKGCAWIGKRHPVKGWQWAITVTAEEPPASAHKSDKTVAVDIGWRAFGDAIRVAIAVDEDGAVRELRLPLDAARTHELRHNIPSGWRDLGVIDSEISGLLERAKAELLLLRTPECSRDLVSHLGRMRQGGLVRMLCELDGNDAWPEAVDVLQKWKSQNDRLRSIRSSLSERLAGRRRWIYRNFAAQLSRSYSRVVLKRLPVRLIHPSGDTPGAAAQYRQWASPAELGLYLRQAAVIHGVIIVEAEAAFSTTTCAQCGEQAAQTPNLVLTCANGHSWDRDVNAACNLLSQLGPNSWQLRHVRERWPQRLQESKGSSVLD